MISTRFSEPLTEPLREKKSMDVCEYLQLPSIRVHINHHADPWIHTHTEQNRKSVWTYTSPRSICALCASHTHTHNLQTYIHMHTKSDTYIHIHMSHTTRMCAHGVQRPIHTHTPSPAHRHVKPMHDL